MPLRKLIMSMLLGWISFQNCGCHQNLCATCIYYFRHITQPYLCHLSQLSPHSFLLHGNPPNFDILRWATYPVQDVSSTVLFGCASCDSGEMPCQSHEYEQTISPKSSGKWRAKKLDKSKSVLPIFFQAIQVALMIVIQRKLFEILVQIISEFLLQTITEQGII